MDKKSIIGLVIIGAVLFGFSWYNSSQQAKFDAEKAKADSVSFAEAKRSAQLAALADTLKLSPEAADVTDTAFREQLVSSLGETLYSSLEGGEEFFTIENDLMAVKLSNKGGRVAGVTLKNYAQYSKKRGEGKPIEMFEESTSLFNLSFFARQQINTADFYFKSFVKRGDDGGESVSMRLFVDSVSYIEYLYTLHPGEYLLDFNINLVGMEGKLSQTQGDIILDWKATSFHNEKGFSNENNYTTVAYKFPGSDGIEELKQSTDTNKPVSEDVKSKVEWVAFKQQFFSSVLIAQGEPFSNGGVGYRTHTPLSGKVKDFSTSLSLPYTPQTTGYDMAFYFGPNKFNILNKYDIGLQKIVPLGGWMIGWINRYIVIPTFDFLGKYFNSFGLIILLLTIFIKIIILPLTYKSYMSMAKMRVLKPEVDALNAKYPDKKDAVKKQQAVMEVYQSAGANPMGGCLPLLIQLPILIAMFRFFPASIELRQEAFLWADDLSSYDSILTLPFDIPFYGSHVSLFTLLMAFSIFISSKISYNQTSSSSPQMPGMKFMMLYMMPLMMVLWFNNYSSGLSYYYLLSNVITIGQTMGFRYFIDEEKLHRKMKSKPKKPRKKSKFMERYEDALKQQQAKNDAARGKKK